MCRVFNQRISGCVLIKRSAFLNTRREAAAVGVRSSQESAWILFAKFLKHVAVPAVGCSKYHKTVDFIYDGTLASC